MWNLAICHLEEIPDSEIVNWYVAGDDSLCSSVPNRYEEVDSIYLLYVQEPVPPICDYDRPHSVNLYISL